MKFLRNDVGSMRSDLAFLAPKQRAPAFAPDNTAVTDRLKKTAQWQRLRWSVLQRDLFTCQWPGCGYSTHITRSLVADHFIPHRGDEAMFWDERDLWCLCESCHSGPKQRLEASGYFNRDGIRAAANPLVVRQQWLAGR